VDVPGQEERKRETEVLGPVNSMTKSEAGRKKLEFITKLELNSSAYQIPSAKTFAHAVKHYREDFAPRMLRDSTFDVADGHLRNHLEADWNDVPVEHCKNIDLVNEWAWKKRKKGLSWTTIKNILRTMQRVLSASSKDNRPPFSLRGLTIPERDKLQMKMKSREKVSFSWQQTKRITAQVHKLERLGQARKDQYAMLFILASAADTRCSELFALKPNDLDFKVDTIRVDESSDQRTKGKIGECKNVAAYRTIVMHDPEGREAMRLLRKFLKKYPQPDPNGLIFRSRCNTPLCGTNVLHDGLHPALRALGLPKAGLHAFRRGCNRRWELSGLNPAVIRQQMGHSSEKMTAHYTGQIPLEEVKTAFSNVQFSSKSGNKIVVLENMENESAA
jgi:integrase